MKIICFSMEVKPVLTYCAELCNDYLPPKNKSFSVLKILKMQKGYQDLLKCPYTIAKSFAQLSYAKIPLYFFSLENWDLSSCEWI